MSTHRKADLVAVIVAAIVCAAPLDPARAALAARVAVNLTGDVPFLINPPPGSLLPGDGSGLSGAGSGTSSGGPGPGGVGVTATTTIAPCDDDGSKPTDGRHDGSPPLDSVLTWGDVKPGEEQNFSVSAGTAYVEMAFVSGVSGFSVAGPGSIAVFTADVEGEAPCDHCGPDGGAGGGAGGAGAGGAGGGRGGGSGGGGNGGCMGCNGDHGASGPTFSLRSAQVRFPLGMIHERLSAGVLRFHEDEPNGNMADRSKLTWVKETYASELGSDVVKNTGGIRQIRTPNLLADIEPNSAYVYKVKLYGLDGLVDRANHEDPNSLYTPDPNALFRYWVVSNPDPNTDTHLLVSEFVRPDGGGASLRASYEFVYGSGTWTLTTRAPNSSTLQVEELTPWVAFGDPNVPQRGRYYSAWDGSSRLIYKERQEETKYTYAGFEDPNMDPNLVSAWRRTRLEIDPNGGGINYATSSTYRVYFAGNDPNEFNYHGVVIESVQRPDGSWSWFNIEPIDPEPNSYFPRWKVERVSGLNDANFMENPDPNDPNVRAVTRVYLYDPNAARYFLESYTVRESGTIVAETLYDNVGFGGGPNSTNVMLIQRTAGGGSTLTSTVLWDAEYAGGGVDLAYLARVRRVTHPDGRVDEHEPNHVGLVIASFPNPHTVTSDPNYFGFFRHAVSHKGDQGSFEPNQSTREVRVVDGEGRPWLDQTYVYSGGDWTLVSWTARTFDLNGRPTAVWGSNHTLDTIVYGNSGCCDETRTDASGVQTVLTRDGLGRITSTVRSVSGQDDITTSYAYASDPNSPLTARLETVATTSDSLTRTTTRAFDQAGRLSSTTTDNGTLKTIFSHGATAEGGRKVTAYRDYAASASSGTATVRDQITEYYCDGRIKKVSGATVIEQRYAYDQAEGERSTEVTTGPGDSTRTTTTYVDMLGRTTLVERPGWSGTLENAYTYDPNTGRLLSVTSPGQAATVFGYDAMGHV